jgi:hypothetical protein
VQQHEEKRKAESGPEVFLPGGGPARALHQRPRLSDRLVRVRADNCQGNPSNYARLIIILYVAYDPPRREMAFRNVYGGQWHFFSCFLSITKGFESGPVRERRGTVLATGHHTRVDCAHRQGGHQHGSAGRGAGRARKRQAHGTHNPTVRHQDQTTHTKSEFQTKNDFFLW